jgi:type I restriction enzyme R subunit
MAEIPRSERKTQNRVIALFIDKARIDCLGEWNKREHLALPISILPSEAY